MRSGFTQVSVVARAFSTLTSTGVNVTAADTVTLGTKTYTFKTALTVPAVANEVLRGGSASASLDNLKAAINRAAGEGTTYATGTEQNASAFAGAKTATTIKVWAIQFGTAGNSIATTELAATLSWTSTVLASGSGIMTPVYAPAWGQLVMVGEDVTDPATYPLTSFVAQNDTDDFPITMNKAATYTFQKGTNNTPFQPGSTCGYIGAIDAVADFYVVSKNR